MLTYVYEHDVHTNKNNQMRQIMTNLVKLPKNYSVPKSFSVDDFHTIISVPNTDIILLVTDGYVQGSHRVTITKPDAYDGIYPCVALHKTRYQHIHLTSDEIKQIDKTVKLSGLHIFTL